MERASVFKSNKSQAVRLPKSVVLPDNVKKVDIVVLGRSRLITPAGEAWDSWFEGEGVTDDFMEGDTKFYVTEYMENDLLKLQKIEDNKVFILPLAL